MFIFLLVLIYLSSDRIYALTPLDAKIRAKRIIGGTDDSIENHPYQVAIELDNSFICSGAIISKNYVLTAAHCINHTNEKIKIRSGTSLREENGVVHDVIDKTIHESYALNEYRNSDYDIGIIKVKPSFIYDESRRSVSLYQRIVPNNFTLKEKLVISGWGYVDHYENAADQLQTLKVPWISKKSCNNYYRKFGGIKSGQICTGYIGKRDMDVCSGDSGGPLIYNDKVIGVAAYTEAQCGLLDYPTVYTEVAYFFEWIKKRVDFD